MGERLWLVRRVLYGFVAFIVLLLCLMVLVARGGSAPSQIAAASNRPIPSLGKLPRPNENEAQANTEHDPHQPHGSPANPVIIKVLPEEKTEAEARKEEYESKEKPSLDRGLTAYTLWLAIFTAALFTAAAVQVGLFWWQLSLLRDSLADGKQAANAAKASADIARKTLITQSRAWLKVKVRLAEKPLYFDTNGGVNLEVILDITNEGREPAINIRQAPWMFIRQLFIPLTYAQRVLQRCEEFRSQDYGMMYSLFPGDKMPVSDDAALRWGTCAERSEVDGGILHVDGRETISIQICGCVTYQTPSDPGRNYQTRFMYNLKVAGNWHAFVGDDVPAALLELQDDKASLGNHAD